MENIMIEALTVQIITAITFQATNYGKPYTFNADYWKGYCDALEPTGQLYKLVRERANTRLRQMNCDINPEDYKGLPTLNDPTGQTQL